MNDGGERNYIMAVWQLSVSAGWLSTRILPAPNAMIAPVTVLGGVLVFGSLFVALGWMTPLSSTWISAQGGLSLVRKMIRPGSVLAGR